MTSCVEWMFDVFLCFPVHCKFFFLWGDVVCHINFCWFFFFWFYKSFIQIFFYDWWRFLSRADSSVLPSQWGFCFFWLELGKSQKNTTSTTKFFCFTILAVNFSVIMDKFCWRGEKKLCCGICPILLLLMLQLLLDWTCLVPPYLYYFWFFGESVCVQEEEGEECAVDRLCLIWTWWDLGKQIFKHLLEPSQHHSQDFQRKPSLLHLKTFYQLVQQS